MGISISELMDDEDSGNSTIEILNGETPASGNPAQAVSIPNGLHTGKRELPSDDDIEIVKSSINATFGLFAYFLLYTGLRRGKALALTYEDIDFDNRIMHINKAISYECNNPVIMSPKTEAGNREVILLDILAEKLDKDKKGLLFSDNGSPYKLNEVLYYACIDQQQFFIYSNSQS